jgi:bacillithiol system protein YtxJ
MSYLERVRQAAEADFHQDWEILNQESQIAELLQVSYEKPVVIFKHSIHCGTSAMIKHHLETQWDFSKEELSCYYLDLINYRSVSNKVAEAFKVVHQSPQIIVLKAGEVVFNTSHLMITTTAIRKALA